MLSLLNTMQDVCLKKKVSIAHSVDADDAFMFYAITEKIIESDSFQFEHILKDIQTLNSESLNFTYDVQAISFYAYPQIEDKYQLLSCGGSLGCGYGPILISKEKINYSDLKNTKNFKIAIPGENTTAYLLLRFLIKDFEPVSFPFDQVINAVVNDKCQIGLLIHEGQLSYLKHGLNKVLDLGEWWLGKTNLPLPLGGNVVKRTFSEKEKNEVNLLIKNSISYAIKNKERIVPYISGYAREIEDDHKLVNKFIGMYVNNFSLDYGTVGKLAIKKLYQMAYLEKLIHKIPRLDFVE